MTRKKLLPLVISSLLASTAVHAGVDLIAVGNIDGSYEDLATQTADPLENGVPGNRLGWYRFGTRLRRGNHLPRPPGSRPECQFL